MQPIMNAFLMSVFPITEKSLEKHPHWKNAYFTSADVQPSFGQSKLPDENPSIGIILCKTKNEEIVELSFSDTSKPMGVATYRTSQELPQRLREALPNIDDLKRLL